ncbi:hypothetical protein DY000_02017323 [Brassica cretica]|uniref:Uncharacterized protein n=1 Tax=Brassica cretica TaxID=69181 RepID=A0ABQ7CV28_BRACR|nr:hypothetical protein DY000_02017323 [Brassica cretica]
MLTGSKELDKILSLGRQDQTSRGLGYTGYGKSDTEPIKFVPSSNSEGRTTSEDTTSKTESTGGMDLEIKSGSGTLI